MNAVLSSTTGFQRFGKVGTLLDHADALLVESEEMLRRGDLPVALEYAYRAALKVAGAWVAQTPVAKRARKPKAIWDQLRLTGPAGAAWAEEFQRWTTLRARASMGLQVSLDAEDVRTLKRSVMEFAYAVEGEAPMVA